MQMIHHGILSTVVGVLNIIEVLKHRLIVWSKKLRSTELVLISYFMDDPGCRVKMCACGSRCSDSNEPLYEEIGPLLHLLL